MSTHVVDWDSEAALDQVSRIVSRGINVVGPEYAKIAQGLAPKSESNLSKPEKIAVRNPSEFGMASGEVRARVAELKGMSAAELAGSVRKSDLPFLRRIGRKVAARAQSPAEVTFERGFLRGRFEQSGRLRKSIRYDGIRREGLKVIGTVRAHVPYAAAIHEGFRHRGGTKKGGKVTNIPGRPFFEWAKPAIVDRLKSAATYKG